MPAFRMMAAHKMFTIACVDLRHSCLVSFELAVTILVDLVLIDPNSCLLLRTLSLQILMNMQELSHAYRLIIMQPRQDLLQACGATALRLQEGKET